MVSAGKSETAGTRRISRPICVGKIEITPVLPGAFCGTKICHIPYSRDETPTMQYGIASKSTLTIQEFFAIANWRKMRPLHHLWPRITKKRFVS
jgi:hypothetical protein